MNSEQQNPAITAYIINVTGLVQGVGFRYAVQQQAVRLRLTGWVRNERNGSVKIHAEGTPERLFSLLDWLESGGPPYSRINQIEHFQSKMTGTFSRFSVEY